MVPLLPPAPPSPPSVLVLPPAATSWILQNFFREHFDTQKAGVLLDSDEC